jgi:peptide-methionine (S)-S-oxide reductase
VNSNQATFAAGCFWGVEKTFAQTPGVIATLVGYTGGHSDNPTYDQVCRGDTGHAESILITFDPEKISYPQLLDIFWHMHNPTTLNRQGPDIGYQYRSAIFYHDDEQLQQALQSKAKLEADKHFTGTITTQIVPAGPFYAAEEYHQKYLFKHGGDYC